MRDGPADRVASLDLIRGVAVLGILAINIAGFAGPPGAVLNPHLPQPGTGGDEIAFSIKFLFFEGKMRALFSMLFGAGLMLYIDRTDAAGGFGAGRQLRRLGWLALFGLAHFYLLWWGDILFLYAVAGVIVLFMHELPDRTLALIGGGVFVLWHAIGAALDHDAVATEQLVYNGFATALQREWYAGARQAMADYADIESAIAARDFVGIVAHRIESDTLRPLEIAFTALGETVPLMLFGLVLHRRGLFAAEWPARHLWRIALACLAAGLALTALLLAWAIRHRFPPLAMQAIFINWGAIPHLLMGFGYLAALTALAPRLAPTWLGRKLIAAGRMAFSNYILTSLVMTALFYGWGLGLFGRHGHAGQWAFVALGWVLMLLWSAPWLAHFRRGPLEWAWRSLIEGHFLHNRR